MNRSPSDMQAAVPTESDAPDVMRKFVRVIERRANGLVAFEFSIGWPELAVDLLLPAADFDEFCTTNRVERLEG